MIVTVLKRLVLLVSLFSFPASAGIVCENADLDCRQKQDHAYREEQEKFLQNQKERLQRDRPIANQNPAPKFNPNDQAVAEQRPIIRQHRF